MFLPNNDMNAYLMDMRRNGTWGDHIILVSLAHALGRTVKIVSSLGDSHNVIELSQTIPTVLQYYSVT